MIITSSSTRSSSSSSSSSSSRNCRNDNSNSSSTDTGTLQLFKLLCTTSKEELGRQSAQRAHCALRMFHYETATQSGPPHCFAAIQHIRGIEGLQHLAKRIHAYMPIISEYEHAHTQNIIKYCLPRALDLRVLYGNPFEVAVRCVFPTLTTHLASPREVRSGWRWIACGSFAKRAGCGFRTCPSSSYTLWNSPTTSKHYLLGW